MRLRRVLAGMIVAGVVGAPAAAATWDFDVKNLSGVYSATFRDAGAAYVVDTKSDKKAAEVRWSRTNIAAIGSVRANGGNGDRAQGPYASQPIRSLRNCKVNSNPFDPNECGSVVWNPNIAG